MQFWQKTAKNKLYCGHTNKKYSILPIFHLIMCASMFAGISSVFSQFMPLELANVVIVIFFIMLCFGVKGASIINVAVSICLVLIVFLVVCEGGLVLLFPSDNSVFQSVLFAISYASMNIASSLPMIEYVCKRNSKKNDHAHCNCLWFGHVFVIVFNGGAEHEQGGYANSFNHKNPLAICKLYCTHCFCNVVNTDFVWRWGKEAVLFSQ